jgi:hypothetical protein
MLDATSVRSDQKSEAWSPAHSMPSACWPLQPLRPKSTPRPEPCTSSSARCIERRYRPP